MFNTLFETKDPVVPTDFPLFVVNRILKLESFPNPNVS